MQMFLCILCSQATAMPIIYCKISIPQFSRRFHASIRKQHPCIFHSMSATLVFSSISFNTSQCHLSLT
uniref:Uncharacterized protein n=1 Tax=Oryza brachyantha TaxID=4533 RepID=J3MWG9_ORYBR